MRPTLYTDVTVAETIMPVGGVERVWEVHSTIDNLDGLCGNSDLVREVGGWMVGHLPIWIAQEISSLYVFG